MDVNAVYYNVGRCVMWMCAVLFVSIIVNLPDIRSRTPELIKSLIRPTTEFSKKAEGMCKQ
jgi:hypothetical protein